MQCVQAVIDCSTTSIRMARRLLKSLGVVDEPLYAMTPGHNSHELTDSSNSQETAFTVEYIEQ